MAYVLEIPQIAWIHLVTPVVVPPPPTPCLASGSSGAVSSASSVPSWTSGPCLPCSSQRSRARSVAVAALQR